MSWYPCGRRKLERTLKEYMYQRNKFSRTYKVKAFGLNVIVFLPEASVLLSVGLSIYHTAFVKGDHTNFEIEPSFGVEASEVYPDVKYTPIDEILN
ncbi:hypothetical protein H5410_052345 [Solanum commersonii]|uniref:NmrA-like domain-containing protein n=1 Tax=Solanum commersonii TaxID=4109 RepID=A0A9J5X3C2_SOLCO|nr:hypothetical protein H5410_052345 [Solanum commersonii]